MKFLAILLEVLSFFFVTIELFEISQLKTTLLASLMRMKGVIIGLFFTIVTFLVFIVLVMRQSNLLGFDIISLSFNFCVVLTVGFFISYFLSFHFIKIIGKMKPNTEENKGHFLILGGSLFLLSKLVTIAVELGWF